MKPIRKVVVAALAASMMLVVAAPMPTVGAATMAAKPVPSLTVSTAYTQFVSARRAFVQYRAFKNPALVRWGTDDTRYVRVSGTVVDFKTTMTFDIEGAEATTFVPAERAAMWIRVRRFRATDGKVHTGWYDAHGGKGFERTPVTSLLPA